MNREEAINYHQERLNREIRRAVEEERERIKKRRKQKRGKDK